MATRDTSGNGVIYINGVAHGTLSSMEAPKSSSVDFIFSKPYSAYSYFSGSIADVQVYNTSLDANQVLALYLKGIGAAPVAPQTVSAGGRSTAT